MSEQRKQSQHIQNNKHHKLTGISLAASITVMIFVQNTRKKVPNVKANEVNPIKVLAKVIGAKAESFDTCTPIMYPFCTEICFESQGSDIFLVESEIGMKKLLIQLTEKDNSEGRMNTQRRCNIEGSVSDVFEICLSHVLRLTTPHRGPLWLSKHDLKHEGRIPILQALTMIASRACGKFLKQSQQINKGANVYGGLQSNG